jgi:hypothetical protein
MVARGCFVLLAGPDGSGKTTVSDALAAHAAAAGLSLSRSHYRPGVFGARPPGSNETERPHDQQSRSLASGALKLMLIAADMTAGYLVRWRRPRRRGILVVERGWWDMAVDPRRYRLDQRLIPLIRLLGRLIPRADLVVLLSGDPAAIDSRKAEIGAHEVNRQLALWERYAPRAARRVSRFDTFVVNRHRIAEAIIASVTETSGPAAWPVRSVPLTPGRLSLMSTGRSRPASDLYQPFHLVRRTMKPLGFSAARHGLARRATEPFDVLALCRELEIHCSGYVLMRSSHPSRWVIGICAGSRLETVVKFATEPDPALEREIATLKLLQDCGPAPFDVPKLRWSGQWQGNTVLAVAGLRSTRNTTSVDDAVQLCNAMVNGFGAMPPVVHGDFAPWNVHLQGGRPVVLDWEASRFARSPLFDLTHFVISSGALLGVRTPQEAAAALCADGSAGARHLVAVGEDPSSAPYFVRRYLALAPISSLRIGQFRAGIERCLATRSFS